MLKPPKETCFNLCRMAHDLVKWVGGDCYEVNGKITVMRKAMIEKEKISEEDKKHIYRRIDNIRNNLYLIEKTLSKYEY